MNAINIMVGFFLLLLGRRLFWVFVAVIGFLWGMALAAQWMANESQWVMIVVGLIAGLIGAALAMLFQRIAIGVAGFLAGSYLAAYLLPLLWVDPGQFTWSLSIIAGIIGAVLFFVIFDWALIVLSSLIGASMIGQAATPDPQNQMLIFLILLVIGIFVQAGMLRRSQRR
jgi:hypothetical protein